MSDKPTDRISTSDRIPHKPTREAAIGSDRREELSRQRAEPHGQSTPEDADLERLEVGSARDSRRNPPHVTENDEDAPVQQETSAPNDVPVLPANASGRDTVGEDEQDEPIDDESMYDRRPERDKDQPPSERARS